MLSVTVYIVTGICLLLSILWWRFKQWRKQLPPGPPCWPIIGNLGMIDTSRTVQEFIRLRKAYGDVFCFVIGHQPVVVVSGHDAMRDLFVKEGDVTSVRPADFFISKLAKWKGIVGSNGTLWKDHRTFSLKVLRDFGFGKRSLESQIQQEVESFLKNVESKKGQPFDILHSLKISIANVICNITMGHTYDHTDKKLLDLMDSIESLFSDTANRSSAGFLWFAEYIPGDPFHSKKRKRIFNGIIRFLQDIIDEHKRTFDEDNIRDYTDAFILQQRNNNGEHGFDDEQLVQTLRDFFVAGHETTVTTLRWCILMLLHYPEVQTKLRQEIENVVGTSRLPSLSLREQMPYCEAFLAETLRLKSIAPTGVPHGLTSDVYWHGYRIPVGAFVIPFLDSVSKDPKTFQDPYKFDPERFIDADGNFSGKNHIIPFGIGRRVCLGESLARIELFLFLTALVQRFEILPVDENSLPSTEGVLGATFSPKRYELRAIAKT